MLTSFSLCAPQLKEKKYSYSNQGFRLVRDISLFCCSSFLNNFAIGWVLHVMKTKNQTLKWPSLVQVLRILIGPSVFPALSIGYMYLLRIAIGPLVFPSLSTGYMYHYLCLDFKMNLLEKVFDLVSASDRLYHIPMLCRLKICFFLVRCQLSPLSSFASQTETPSSFEVFLFLHLVCKLSGKINKTYFSSIYNSHLSFHPFSSSLIRSCDYAI